MMKTVPKSVFSIQSYTRYYKKSGNIVELCGLQKVI